MNRDYAVLYNRSLESIFGNQARAIAKDLDCPAHYTDEVLFKKDAEIVFSKCVYLDKDVVTGLRLEGLGVRLYNNIGSIELCDDKRRTYELLKKDLPLPRTVSYPLLFSEDTEFEEEFIEKTADTLSFPLVSKLAYGSLGEQVRLIQTTEELKDCCTMWRGHPILFQEYVSSSHGKDLRVYVVGGEVIAAMERSNPSDFRSNIASGGSGKQVNPSPAFRDVAIQACHLLGLDFAGVDLLYGPAGEPLICEVNSNALFNELNTVCNVQIEKNIAQVVQQERRFEFNISDFTL